MKPFTFLLAATAWVLALGTSCQASDSPNLTDRWFYLSTNLLIEKNVTESSELAARAAAGGYNGVVITDSKFMKWDRVPPEYAPNVAKFREACRAQGVAFIAGVMPLGRAGDLLIHDPNLAEALPVRNARFVVRDGSLVPTDAASVRNGGFEQWSGASPAGWDLADSPGRILFADRQIVHEGTTSIRMQDFRTGDPRHGLGRVMQKIPVRPFGYYHVSVWIRTEGFELPRKVNVAVLGPDDSPLCYQRPRVAETQDWERFDLTFHSLENPEVRLYIGVWGGGQGRVWFDDVRIEPAGMINIVRRDGAPLTAVLEEGGAFLTEGTDFEGARDSLLGVDPNPGSFTGWHTPPLLRVPTGSRLREGQNAVFTYYTAPVLAGGQVMCCMSEPKVYDILRWQIQQVRDAAHPDGYLMNHDEIRVQGWDESCARRNQTPGQILADNVRRCTAIIHEMDPGKPVYVWSDMFDPEHNAGSSGRYYLVKGDGPWTGSWEGLAPDVGVVNWNSDPGKRRASMKFFAGRGNRQILAGYYDDDPTAIAGWLADGSGINGVSGVMYTTWSHRFEELDRFAGAAWGSSRK